MTGQFISDFLKPLDDGVFQLIHYRESVLFETILKIFES